MPGKMHVFNTRHSADWIKAIENCPKHDFYHLPQYHAMAEHQGQGDAILFQYCEGKYSIALPLLTRRLNGLPGIRTEDADRLDATSVYGYSGPIVSDAEVPSTVILNFQEALHRCLIEMGIITVFSRLHPLFSQHAMLNGMGECRTLSQTVSIDLSLPLEEQMAGYRPSVKMGINKLRRQGVVCVRDCNNIQLGTFIEIYHETMRRVGAAKEYFFPAVYFRQLSNAFGQHFHLFLCALDGNVMCGGLFIECNGILQFHLGGTRDDALMLSPSRLLVDGVRRWAVGRGLNVLHLGGGSTARPDDSLLHFKLGFSKRTHDFSVWRWVLDPVVYERVCADSARCNEENVRAATAADYFPKYRTLAASTAPERHCVDPVDGRLSTPSLLA